MSVLGIGLRPAPNSIARLVSATVRYGGRCAAKRRCFFLGDPDEALAAVILFDQFPRNMFREEADSFATDGQALSIARQAIDMGYDEQLDNARKSFLYMPFMHSEAIKDQDRSVDLFRAAGLRDNIGFAEGHRDLIQRFGRFPHRNPVLGRESSAAELQAIEDWHS